MSADVAYEIARFGGDGHDAPLERLQLRLVDGLVRIRDIDGTETRCAATDIEAAICSTPSLREIRAGQTAQISCRPGIAAKLPLLLEPVPDGEDASECYAEVNGESWAAYATLDGDYVMLAGYADDEPEMSPLWAEQGVVEGEWNPLLGYTSIGLATPSVAVEYARYDHGGIGGGCAVAVTPFDDFVSVFVDWLLNGRVLAGLWEGDSLPYSPTVRLFADASAAADKKGRWNNELDRDDQGEGEDGDDDRDEEAQDEASAYLKLNLPDELVDQVRLRLRSLEEAN